MTELPDHAMRLAEDERVAFVQALQAIRNRVRWKPGKDIIYLKKTTAYETPARHRELRRSG